MTEGLAYRIAGWSETFAASPIAPESSDQIRMILLDALACAFAATDAPKIAKITDLAPDLGGSTTCAIIGSQQRTGLPSATLLNGILIRALDWNDRYNGPRQTGHPSDNLGAALAAAEMADRSGLDLIRAVRLGYEIYGRLLDLTDPNSPWDHVSVSGMTTAAMIGWLLRLDRVDLGNAIALAATHSATLGEVRADKVSGAKSIASAVVAQTAATLTLLARAGVSGPETAIEGQRGYATLLLDDAAERFLDLEGPDRVMSVGFKPYPCFALGQAPVDAAIELHGLVQIDQIAAINIYLSDSPQARNRIGAGHKDITSSEAADHDLGVLVAMATIDGLLVPAQFEQERWRSDEVRRLASRISLHIEDMMQPARHLPCRMEVTLDDGGTMTLVRGGAPGSPASPLDLTAIETKFRNCATGKLGSDRCDEIVASISNLEAIDSIRRFVRILTN